MSFKDNQIKTLKLPISIERIDQQAFAGNSITKVTIKAGVTLGDRVFYDNPSDNFKSLYTSLGAGTYNYSGGTWSKE